jgi:prepilin-type N-terminal cleavage/methylation domain-containing protein
MKKAKQSKGFTLIELIIVIVIVGILALVSVPIYNGYVRNARSSEGRALVGAVSSAEQVYAVEHNGVFIAVPTATPQVGTNQIAVNATNLNWFHTYAVALTANGYTVTATGDGDAAGVIVTLVYNTANAVPTSITVTGL